MFFSIYIDNKIYVSIYTDNRIYVYICVDNLTYQLATRRCHACRAPAALRSPECVRKSVFGMVGGLGRVCVCECMFVLSLL